MKYAGFWVRAGAGLIDFIVFLPLMVLFFWAETHSRTGTLLLVIPYYLSYAAFCILFLANYGKTPGKMMMKIEVKCTDGARIGFKEALKRHSIDAVFGFIAGVGMMIAVLHTEPTIFNADMAWLERNQTIMGNRPKFATIAEMLSSAWVFSELIVLLFNKRKRAIHDYIAGTVVVHASKV